ncbi:MAG: NADH-quinone oxidoreductase subunit NuoF [Deltaproteobacteria bacterium]|nr:NADH-quinone oxidoreductase subunit NuoF [Deltaproteobacteria bacterium]
MPAAKHKIVTAFEGIPQSRSLETYLKHGGYQNLKKALSMKPDALVDLVKASGLRGRGGAGFPTGLKWSFIPKDSKERYLVCNNDEGEPGTFKDRYILELSPHMLLEGMIITAYAIQSKKGYVYTRCEFYEEIEWLNQAIDEAYETGYLGENIIGSGFSFNLDHYIGAGAYVCGEETGMLSSLEGKKGYPKLKPPFPAVAGYLGKPTIINNTETLATIPWIIEHGAEAFRKFGTEKSPGTKLFCVSGPVKNPGVFERPLGYPLQKLIYEDAGGLIDGKELKAVIPGGASSPVLNKEDVMTMKLDFESLAGAGSMLGSGAVIVIPHDVNIFDVFKVTADFFHHESCGQCTPCREGTGWIANILQGIEENKGSPADFERIYKIATQLMGRTICALSDAAAMPARGFVNKFRDELNAYIETKRNTR